MGLSENIKKFRLEKQLTQEQLAAKLNLSAQAVSKWETSETYPDGAILVSLANELGVSLDELFGNDTVSMSDISRRIISLIHETDSDKRFHLARDICWQIERGLFNCRMGIEKKYDADEIKNQHNASYILDDHGFTLVSNGKEPFFAVFPQPEYVFESAVLAKDCHIQNERMDTVIENLSLLQIIQKQELSINGQKRILFYSQPSHKLLALFLIAREIKYKGAYTLQSHHRNTPFFKE